MFGLLSSASFSLFCGTGFSFRTKLELGSERYSGPFISMELAIFKPSVKKVFEYIIFYPKNNYKPCF